IGDHPSGVVSLGGTIGAMTRLARRLPAICLALSVARLGMGAEPTDVLPSAFAPSAQATRSRPAPPTQPAPPLFAPSPTNRACGARVRSLSNQTNVATRRR